MGKWHLGDEIFRQQGFDEWVSIEDGYIQYYSDGRNEDERSSYHHWLIEKGYEPNENNIFTRQFATSLPIEHCKPSFLSENATRFINQNADKPFVLYVNFLEPHTPFNGPLNDLHEMSDIKLPENYNDLPWENVQGLEDVPEAPFRTRARDDQILMETKRKYWGLVSQVDRSVGAILSALEEEGLAGNTIIVYTSDHGEMMGAHRMMGKNNPFEEATRVPLIIFDPRSGMEQRILDRPVSLIDLVPTLLDLMGTDMPLHLQGKSLAPVIKGDDYPGRYVFSESRNFRIVVSPDDWKLVIMDKINFLFNLNDDPLEKKNLYYLDEYKDKKELLLEKLADWQEQTNDPYILAIE
jgi:arylsulfatase A-like enzyme